MARDCNEPFVVSDRIRELAKREGWPDPDTEIDAFIDYHEATNWKRKGNIKITNREAAFRTWLRNCAKWNKPPEKKYATTLDHTKKQLTIHAVAEPIQRLQGTRHDPRVHTLLNDLVSKLAKKA